MRFLAVFLSLEALAYLRSPAVLRQLGRGRGRERRLRGGDFRGEPHHPLDSQAICVGADPLIATGVGFLPVHGMWHCALLIGALLTFRGMAWRALCWFRANREVAE